MGGIVPPGYDASECARLINLAEAETGFGRPWRSIASSVACAGSSIEPLCGLSGLDIVAAAARFVADSPLIMIGEPCLMQIDPMSEPGHLSRSVEPEHQDTVLVDYPPTRGFDRVIRVENDHS